MPLTAIYDRSSNASQPSSQAKPGQGGSQPTAVKPPEGGNLEANVIGTDQDYQLERAVDLLRGVSLFGNRMPH